MKHFLHILNGPEAGKRIQLSSGAAIVGRDRNSRIVVQDDEVSRRHARIRLENGDVTIEDLNSSNGTFVNHVVIEKADLGNGDQLQLGKTKFIYLIARELDAVPEPIPMPLKTEERPNETHTDALVEYSDPLTLTHALSREDPAAIKNDLQFMYDAAIAVSQADGSKTMCLRLLSLIFDWIAADRGCILLRDDDESVLVPQAVKYRSNVARRHKLTVSQTIVNYVTQNEEGILSLDPPGDERWAEESSSVDTCLQEAICVPIRGRFSLYGVIYIDRIALGNDTMLDRESFTSDQLKLITAVGHQAAVVIEGDNLHSEIAKNERHTAIGRSLAALSHHIKNVLQSVNGGRHLIEKGIEKSNVSLIQCGWQIVRGNQQRISNLMLDMLNYSKPVKPIRRWCDINEVISGAIQAHVDLATQQGIQLTSREMPDGQHIWADPHSLRTAIGNVLAHATPFQKKINNGRISISASLNDNDTLRVHIEDNFQSATDAELEKMFVPMAFESEQEVRGISLAVSDKIVREHDGFIEVYRNDEGLTFELIIPMVGNKQEQQRAPVG